MKYIITEEQLTKNIKPYILHWIKRRYDLVRASLKETFEYMEFDICRIDDYEKFEKKFFSVFMDCLHPFVHDHFVFGGDDAYDVMYNVLKDFYSLNCKEFYFNGRKDC